MSTKNLATLQRATALETSVIKGDYYKGNTKVLFTKIDNWKEVFRLRSNGMSFNAIARMLGINRKTASSRYHRYIELQSSILTTRLETDQMLDISETLQRLEDQREQVSMELALMDNANLQRNTDGTLPKLRAEDYAAKLATRRQLLDIEKQITEIKRGLGIWQEYQPGEFTEAHKRHIENHHTNIQKTKLDRIQVLLAGATEKSKMIPTTEIDIVEGIVEGIVE